MASANRINWKIPAALIVLSLVPLIAGVVRVAQLASGAAITHENARFFAAPLPVLLHIPSACLFCILGAFQFVAGIRSRWPTWHRVAGRVLIPCGLIAALSGLRMAQSYSFDPRLQDDVLYALRILFGSAMVLSIFAGLLAIRRRDIASHRAWMMRGYAIGLGAGTQVVTYLPWFLLVGEPGVNSRAFLMGAGWVINLAVAEWLIRSRQIDAGSLAVR